MNDVWAGKRSSPETDGKAQVARWSTLSEAEVANLNSSPHLLDVHGAPQCGPENNVTCQTGGAEKSLAARLNYFWTLVCEDFLTVVICEYSSSYF